MSLVTHLPNFGLFRSSFIHAYFVPTYYRFAYSNLYKQTIMTESTFQYTIIPIRLTIIQIA